jgi:hypothetical protein
MKHECQRCRENRVLLTGNVSIQTFWALPIDPAKLNSATMMLTR